MRTRLLVLAIAMALCANAMAQTPAVDPETDLSRVPSAALARMQPELRAAEASSLNFLPGDAGPFTASGQVAIGDPISIIPRRHAHAAMLDAPLVQGNTVLLDAGAPLYRWHLPSPDSSRVMAFWCGVSGEHAICFDDASIYAGEGALAYWPTAVTRRGALAGAAPSVHDIAWEESGLPVMEWVMFFEGWERNRVNVSRGVRVNDVVYGRRETFYQRRDPQQGTPMALQNHGRVVATPGADAHAAMFEVTTPEDPYAPNEYEVMRRATVTFLGRPVQ